MATAKTTRIKRYKPNGTHYRKLAGDYPRFFIREDGSVDELTHQERALLQFRRCLPEDLRPEYDKILRSDGGPIEVRVAEFDAKLAPRRAELVGW